MVFFLLHEEYGDFVANIDREKSKMKSIGYREDRVPRLFAPLVE